MSKDNPARRTSIVWWILTPVFLFLTFFLISSGKGDAAYAIAFFSFIMFITAIIVAVVYGSRAKKLDRILSGEGLLVHWTYTPDEWRNYTEKAHEEKKSANKILFFIISGFAIVIGAVFFIMDPESGKYVFLAMLGLIAIIGFVAWFTAWHGHRQNLRYLGEAYISKDGIYLNKQLHLWNMLTAYLGSVEYTEETQPSLVFSYFAPTRTGLEERDVRVPVPHGQESRAKEILEQFQAYVGKH